MRGLCTAARQLSPFSKTREKPSQQRRWSTATQKIIHKKRSHISVYLHQPEIVSLICLPALYIITWDGILWLIELMNDFSLSWFAVSLFLQSAPFLLILAKEFHFLFCEQESQKHYSPVSEEFGRWLLHSPSQSLFGCLLRSIPSLDIYWAASGGQIWCQALGIE